MYLIARVVYSKASVVNCRKNGYKLTVLLCFFNYSATATKIMIFQCNSSHALISSVDHQVVCLSLGETLIFILGIIFNHCIIMYISVLSD